MATPEAMVMNMDDAATNSPDPESGFQRVSLAVPADLLRAVEAERERLAAQLGARISLNQAATALLRRGLSAER